MGAVDRRDRGRGLRASDGFRKKAWIAPVVARYLFGEPLTPVMMLGIGFIIAGVLTIEMAAAVD